MDDSLHPVPCRIPAPVTQDSVVNLQQYLQQSVHLFGQSYTFLLKTQKMRKFWAEKWTVYGNLQVTVQEVGQNA